jgi:hypothetical protein
MNVKTPASGMARASGNVIVGTADTSEIAHRALEIQTTHLRRRFNLTPAVAAVVAGLAYGQADSWRVRA